MKILIISTNALGDTYLSASAIQCVKNNLQNAEIHFVTTSESEFILASLKNATIHIINKNIVSIIFVLSKIFKYRFEYVFTFFPGVVNTLFYSIARSKYKAGYTNYFRVNDWYSKNHQITIKKLRHKKDAWKPNDNYLDRIKYVLNAVGFNANSLSKKIFDEPESKNPDYVDKIILHVFSREVPRALTTILIKRLCEYITLKYDKKIILIGVAKEIDVELAYYIEKSQIKFLGNLSLNELVKTIYSSQLFIGVDSFPLHVADSYNINFIGLFSCTNPSSVLINYNKAIVFNSNSFTEISEEEFSQTISSNELFH